MICSLMLEAIKKRFQTQNKTSFGNGFQNHNNENKFDNKKKKRIRKCDASRKYDLLVLKYGQ